MSAQSFGRFGHHPNPVIDFCVEVESLLSEIKNHGIGFTNGTPNKEELRRRIAMAMDFKVGGDTDAVLAKQQLRAAVMEAQPRKTIPEDIYEIAYKAAGVDNV